VRLWSVAPDGSPRKAGLAARVRRHPAYREPDPTRTPSDGLGAPPAPGGSPTETVEPIEPDLDPELAAKLRLVSSRPPRPVDDERAWRRIGPVDEEIDR
jgi:hypothetical protein